MDLAQKTYAKYYDRRAMDPPNLKEGDQVWLNAKHLTTTRSNKKLDLKYIGPYTIIKKINAVVYELDLPPTLSIHPVFHVSLLEPYREGHPEQTQAPPPATTVEGQEEYEPERILDSRLINGHHEFLIKWAGFTDDHNEWKTYDDVKHLKVVRAFARKHPEKPLPTDLRRQIRQLRSHVTDAGEGDSVIVSCATHVNSVAR
jgi:hypothetical protein